MLHLPNFLAVEPAAAAAALLIHHQQNVNPTTLNEFLTNGTTHNNNDLSRNGRPPTPYAVTTHTYSGKECFYCLSLIRIHRSM